MSARFNRKILVKDRTASVQGRFARTPQIIESASLGILFFAAVFLTVMGSLLAISDDPNNAHQGYQILWVNLGLIIILGIYLLLRAWSILFGKSRRSAAPLLHRRFVLIFSLAALTPAILVGAFSASLISENVNDHFGNDVRQTLDNANNFLDSYVADELRTLGADTKRIKQFLETNQQLFTDRVSFFAYLQRLSRSLGVDSIYILDREGRVLSQAFGPRSPELKIPLPPVFSYMSDQPADILFNTRDDLDYLSAYTRLDGYPDSFLFVGRFMKSDVGVLSSIKAIDNARSVLSKYDTDRELYSRIYFLTILETAFLILFTAIITGVFLANRIIEPLGRMVEGAEKVRSGDLTARVDVKGDWGEMSDLGSAFNRMTQQLSAQREELVKEHNLSERRRQFTEAVLSGVRAGVIGLSEEGRITLMNASADRLIGGRLSGSVVGQPIAKALPAFAPAFIAARESVSGMSEDQINYETDNGVRNFDLRVSGYKGENTDTGWVLTFDDMTRLVTAQRFSAWREVARRIAHEIKNPLTPILLSAERLKRKYAGQIHSDPEIFNNCTDTIIRQVTNLEQMVNEFSSFARMPAPALEEKHMRDILDAALFAQGVAFPEVKFTLDDHTNGNDKVFVDERLIGQALTNVYKNAAESIAGRVDASGVHVADGLVETILLTRDENLVVAIKDNGLGWPFPDTHRLLEPYVTTRDSGTGLGLAIVNRIAEDHMGQLVLSDRPDHESGAYLEFILPLHQAVGTMVDNRDDIKGNH